MRIVAIVQARMGSTRLPNKVMKLINGVPMIELLLRRLKRSKEIHHIVVATSTNKNNLLLIEHVRKIGFACELGSETDVMQRYIDVANKSCADVIVRITGDCPLVDPELVDTVIRGFKSGSIDYVSNIEPPTYPDGLDVEVFSIEALKKANFLTVDLYDREHVTPYLRRNNLFKILSIQHSENLSSLRWTVDELADFETINRVFNHFMPNTDFTWHDVLALQRKNPELFHLNQNFFRNEGALMSLGQKQWRRAKQIIPGGNMLLSKRPEMFLPNQWPVYFSKAKGCELWDLDGKKYIDVSLMGVGTNILGYGHPEVDLAVCQAINAGNMSSLNCSEEVLLAEELIQLHPWADMVRFARSGGEANAIAIRIARSASGKDKVAICGYHGWHDWYLASNLGMDKSLDGHLLPGLEPNGVPRNLKDTVFSFNYNNFAELERLVNNHDIGVIKMEVMRNKEPENEFLHKVRKLATDRNIVLIFDECTSGFRESFGGLHKKFGVEPDMAIFGKALGNGYAISAIIGKRDVMEAAQNTFISSTFWTERIGPTAALASLKVMQSIRSWETITHIGLNIRKEWQRLAEKNGLKIDCWGLPALTGFTFKSVNALAYKTLISQEMLAKGYLAGNCIYVCVDHTSKIIEDYLYHLSPIFTLIKECEEGRDVMTLLKGPICHDGFRRLN